MKKPAGAGFSVSAKAGSERVAADRAVARAELVGLQAVEDAQHLVGIAAHVEVVHAHVLDRVVRIDDEGGAQGDAFGAVADAELVDERALRVAEAPVAELAQVLVITAPAELGELVVGRAAEQDRVALLELLRELVEADDLGRADEGEVLRPEVDDLPLAGKALFGEGLERRDAV